MRPSLASMKAGGTFILAFGALCGLASADTITIGTTNAPGNAFPFTDPGYFGEYQQAYNGALFPGSVSITQITFFLQPGNSTEISGDFRIDLSTTSASTLPGGLSDIYANNIGPDNAQFFSGAVSDVLSFIGAPFPYNPAKGNLLLDVNVLSPNGALGFLADGCSTDTNRVFNFGGTGSPTQDGLVCSAPGNTSGFGGLETEFTFTRAAVPAPPIGKATPANIALLGGALALFLLPGCLHRSGRRR